MNCINNNNYQITGDASLVVLNHSKKPTLYVDGGCKGIPGPAGWGIVIVNEDGKALLEAYGVIGSASKKVRRSNWALAAQIKAAIIGLNQTKEGSEIEIVSVNYHLLKGLSEWRFIWERRGFKNSIGYIVNNNEQWMHLYALADLRKVTLRWVRGDAFNHHNERCDVLGSQAIALLLNEVVDKSI